MDGVGGVQKRRKSRLAVASCLLALAWPLSLLLPRGEIVTLFDIGMPFFLGIIALFQISRSRGMLSGHSFAMVGMVVPIGILCLGYSAPQSNDDAEYCKSNLKQIAIAMDMYLEDWKGYYPPPKVWNDALLPYVESETVFTCRSATAGKPSYAMWTGFEGQRRADIENPKNTILVFESVSGKNLVGVTELFPGKARHGCYNILFANGSVESFSEEQISKFVTAVDKAKTEYCASNLKQLSIAMMMYLNDYDGKYPAAGKWKTALIPYVNNDGVFQCPLVKGKAVSYGMNTALSSRNDNRLKNKKQTVLFFDAEPGKKISGGPELLPVKPRHSGGVHNIAFIDGHAKAYTDKEARALAGWKVKGK